MVGGLQMGLKAPGCVCTALPYLCNPGELLEVMTLGPKSGRAGVVQQESGPVPVRSRGPGVRGSLLDAEERGRVRRGSEPSEPKWKKQCRDHTRS